MSEISERVLFVGAQMMRTERQCEQLGLGWDLRLRNRSILERYLTKHGLTWNQVADYERAMRG